MDYFYNSNFISFDKFKTELLKKKNNKIFIIISLCFSFFQDYYFIDKITKNLVTNYLSYIYFITQDEQDFNIFSGYNILTSGHVIKYVYEENIENKIKSNIVNKFKEIDENFKNFAIKRMKYNKIIEYYEKLYKYILIGSSSSNIDEKENFKDIINLADIARRWEIS